MTLPSIIVFSFLIFKKNYERTSENLIFFCVVIFKIWEFTNSNPIDYKKILNFFSVLRER